MFFFSDLLIESSTKTWKFIIEVEETNILKTTDTYKLQISYKSDPSSTAKPTDTTADCILVSGTNTLSCSVKFTSNTLNNYIFFMKPTITLNDRKAIIWSNTITDTAIILKTDLTFVKGTLSHPSNWFLKLDVKDATNNALPITSKVIININNDGTEKDVICTAKSNVLLECDTGITDLSIPNLTLKKEKSSSTSITWKNTETNEDFYYFYLETKLEFVSVDNLEFNQNNKWQFKLKTSNYPENYKIIVDVLYGGQSSTATCVKHPINSEFKLCVVDNDSQSKSSLVKLNHIKSSKSTITWNSLGSAQDIITFASLNVKSVKGRIYQNSKWSFKMYLENCDLPLNSKVKIDLNYGGASTATCSLNAENILTCVPDKDPQSEEDKFTITYSQSLGTVTYSSSEANLLFVESINLTLVKLYDLMLKDSKWEFKIGLTNSNLEGNTNINVDIKLNGRKTKAQCTYTTNLLTCTVNKENNSDRIILINDANNSDFVWTNTFNDIELFVVYNVIYVNCYGGFDGSKWRFVMKYTKNIDINNNVIGNYALLETLVGSTDSTARCKISEKFLECESQHSGQTKDDVIKIKTTSTNEGTISITSTSSEIQFQSIPLTMTFSEINNFNYGDGKISFILKGNLKDNLEEEVGENTITKINLVIKKKDNTNTDLENVVCFTNAINNKNGPASLTCEESAQMNKDEDDVEIKISSGKSGDITFDSTTENIKAYDHTKKSSNNDQQNTDKNGKNKGLIIKINYLFTIFLFLLL